MMWNITTKVSIGDMEHLGIYIHIPFCVKKCDYCDFLSAPAGEEMMEQYVNALIKEIEYSRNKMAEYLVDTVFIGGGTPSILEENLITRILHTLRENCNLDAEAEITIECNPGTVTEEKLRAYKKTGINRISFGLQSANDIELKSIGRIHTYDTFLESYSLARRCGFDNINIDLMSALPGQTLDSYQETLKKVVALEPEHISAYSLIVEEETPMYERVTEAEKKGDFILPNEDDEREMYYMTKQMLSEAGYERYEISNYARQGYECRHNIGYWRRKDYLGFGIGAASLHKGERYSNVRDIREYRKRLLEEAADGMQELRNDISDGRSEKMNNQGTYVLDMVEESRQRLSVQETMEEFMFLGLRMIEGVSISEFQNVFGKSYEEVYGKTTHKLIEQGLIEEDKDCVRLTERGVDVSNYVMAEFLL